MKMKLPIKSKRLYITGFNESMAEAVHLNSLDDDNRRFVPDEVFETVEDARQTISYLISCYMNDNAPLVYPVILNEGINIGYVQAIPLEEGWEIGFHIAAKYTGKGYATEAVNAFLPLIMQHLDLTKIIGICHFDNIASRRVLEKCGFTLEFEGLGSYFSTQQHICRYHHYNEFEILERMDDFFDKRANMYETHMLDDLGLDDFYEDVDNCFDHPVIRILGLGCGTGLEFKRLFERFPDMEVTGIDLSREMLKIMETKFPDKNIRTICGSYFDVDFEGFYDHVLSTYSLHHFSQEKKLDLYKRIYDALQPGGRFIFGDYTVPTIEQQEEILAENEKKRSEQGIAEDEIYHFDTPFIPETELHLMKSAGFKNVVISKQRESATLIIAEK